MLTENPPKPRATKSATIQDIARTLGIDKSTVSRALSGHPRISASTREAVQAAARELNFQPNPFAQQLSAPARNNTICLYSDIFDLGVTAQKLQLLQKHLHAKGFNAPLYCDDLYCLGDPATSNDMFNVLRRQRPAAIIYNTAGQCDLTDAIEQYRDEGGIVVTYDFPLSLPCDGVIFDRENNTYQAARHVLELGHRRVGLHFNDLSPRSERLDGFCRAMNEFGAPVRQEWLFGGIGGEEAGAHLAHRYLALDERPTALCIINDTTAVGFMIEIQRHDLQVPRDVSVVGHDDLSIARFGSSVRLTTAQQPLEEIAQNVLTLLDQRLADPHGETRQVTIRAELIVRESTAPPPQTAYTPRIA